MFSKSMFLLCCTSMLSVAEQAPPTPPRFAIGESLAATLPERLGTTRMHGLESFDSDSLRHDGPDQWRWLSIPGSRLVLNPSLITERSTPLCPALAMHVGFYEGAHPQRMQHLLSMRFVNDDHVADGTHVWREKRAPAREWVQENETWSFHGVREDIRDGAGVVTVSDKGDPWGWAAYRVAPPFGARSGFLRVEVPQVDGAWALKIGHDTLPVDVYIQHDTQRPGVYTYDLSRVAGWQGKESFDLKFFAVGRGASAALASLDLELRAEDPDRGLASSVDSCWHPHQLTFEANYAAPKARVQGADFFQDENTLVRRFTVANLEDTPALMLFEGQPYYQACEVYEESGLLRMSSEGSGYDLLFSQRAPEGHYRPVPISVEENAFQWLAAIPIPPGETDLAVSVSFYTGVQPGLEEVRRNAEQPAYDALLAARKQAWDAYLARVPAPMHFGIEGLDAKGVTALEHRRTYYAAWAFVIQNVLPPMPENEYHHTQTPTGKPSLWAEGSSLARASAAWESFFAQQLLTFVAPDIAWDAFEGIMMQVDADGWLDGEVLPSRKAQTAWILYAHSGDRARLEAVYPPISRYLRWREKNPRWIYLDHDNPHQRDSNFVDSLLLDLEFAIRIARVLDEDAEEWHAMAARVKEAYVNWFFPEDREHPVQYYYEDTGEHHTGHPTWVCSGLYIEGLPEPADKALMSLFRSMYDPDQDLAGLDFCKHPIASMIVHGLLRRGLKDEADGYMQAILRDVIRSGRFSENYSFNPLRSWGVEDSMFGAATMIEFTLLRNGVRIDRGLPEPAPAMKVEGQ